jgi:tryptophanyl-tRNA synthetase
MKRLVSGITPSGDGSLHIGNYLGAVRQFIKLAKTSECFLFVADLHALTTIQNKVKLESNVETLILNELALLRGFLTEDEFSKLIFYRQSDVGVHPELQTILNNVTPLGLLRRAHAYKDKLANEAGEEDINLGLFNYPILMAADILLYKPDIVPVGKDQKQHIEITRDIAGRFNKIFSRNVFTLPEAYIQDETASVPGTDGKRKMSKSLGNIISIFEPEDVIRKQVNSTFTDPARAHADDPGHVEGNMVFSYLDYFGEPDRVSDLKARYVKGIVSDVEVKAYLFDSLMHTFESARHEYAELKTHPGRVKEILAAGAAKARNVAENTMVEVRQATGITNKYSVFSYANNGTPTGDEGVITIDDFARVEVRVGLVENAENVEGSEKLIRLTVSFGDSGIRTIFTGVRGYGYTPEDFNGKQFMFVTNLKPRKMMGEESQGMILAVDGLEQGFGEHGGAKPYFISAEGLPQGAKVR